MRVAKAITISSDERKTLGKWGRGRSTPGRLVLRAKIVLAAADGTLNKDIAAELGTGMKTVCLWRNRFAKSVWRALSGMRPVAVDHRKALILRRRLCASRRPRSRMPLPIGARGRWRSI